MNHSTQPSTPKRLILRLSSLGDVVLATAALESPRFSEGVDWVVAKEFAPLLEGHPRIRRVFTFDRKKQGLRGWWELNRQLFNEGYDEVFDLHSTLRSRLAQGFFYLLSKAQRRERPRWHRVSKQRLRLLGLYVFKRFWPQAWRPSPWVERFSRIVGGTGRERPDLRHLIRSGDFGIRTGDYLCVMPSAQWVGKRWPVGRFLEVVQRTGFFPVILGTARDQASVQMASALSNANLPHYSGVGIWSLPEVATVLSRSRGYLGNDTGLAHLAEAVGVPAYMIFGPTSPQMGFGPWRSESRAFESSMGCHPCGKDGSTCIRLARHECLRRIAPNAVAEELLRGVRT